MTRIILKNPTPATQRLTGSDIHDLVCKHEKEWRTLPELRWMHHTRAGSRVTSAAWMWYAGIDSEQDVANEFKVAVETLRALARVLGIQRVVWKNTHTFQPVVRRSVSYPPYKQ